MAASRPKIKNISALEVLDSRGRPTLSVTVVLSDGTVGCASVPAGTSAGEHEARELRDGDERRYGGYGVQRAVRMVEEEISPALSGRQPFDPARLDRIMMELDGTADKSRLGANSILGVSMAACRAAAASIGMPLYEFLAKSYKLQAKSHMLPQPMFNLLNGGMHAESGMDIQEFMLVPRASSFTESVRWAAETFVCLQKLIQGRRLETGVGLEGGFSPKLHGSREAIEMLLEAAKLAGLPKEKTFVALDVAASGLYENDRDRRYVFKREKTSFSREQLISWYAELVGRYPIVSVEDGLEENDWEGWTLLNARLGGKVLVVGDDLTCTDRLRLLKAIEAQAVSSLIIKPNQIGTVSETMETIVLAKKHGLKLIVSHRSGDTPDSFIADLAVASGAEYIKSGSVTRGERIAKYNRLMEIEKELSAD